MRAHIAPGGRPADCFPLTATRDLADCPAGPQTFLAAQIAEFESCGCRVEVDEHEPELSGDPIIFHPGNVWLDRADIRLLMDYANEQPLALRDADGHILAYLATRVTMDDGIPVRTASASFRLRYPWDFLELMKSLLGRIAESRLEGTVSDRATIAGKLVLGPGSRILPGVYLEGTVVVGRDTQIGPNCYLRGPIVIGDRCKVGQSCEVKASILMDGAHAAHLSYVGDSILGERVNFGAGTITANFRHDGGNHLSQVGNDLVDTGRRKLGTVCGDDVHTGIHTSIYPGRKLWPRASTLPGEVVKYDIAD